MKQGFFAYSSKPSSCGDAIEAAITEINGSGLVQIKSWKSLNIPGKLIINEILKQIDESDFFCVDITNLNDNVLFELGYAIGKNRPIWIILDSSHLETTRRFRELGLFTTIGYDEYTNTAQIVANFYKRLPHESASLMSSLLDRTKTNEFNQPLFFLKNQVDTNYSKTIQDCIDEYKLTYCLDDAVETKVNNLCWYIERLLKIPAILAELSTTARAGYEVQNSKCATICGIATGMNLKVLMACEEPYDIPIDYREMLVKYNNAKECKVKVLPFLEALKNDFFQLSQKKAKYSVVQRDKKTLQGLNFGEFLAEHEGENISRYYVETLPLSSLIKSEYNLVVGRKGCGKTATLYYLKSELEAEKNNLVCTIKPISFELEGMMDVIRNIPKDFERSYLFESVWKLLIYTEVARSIYEAIQSLPAHAVTSEKQKYLEFVENNKEVLLSDLHTRIVEKLSEISTLSNAEGSKDLDFKVRVSELLHQKILGEIRDQVFNVFPKGINIYLLMDNLDKSWKDTNNIEFQCRWLLSLLGVTGRIIRDFSTKKMDHGVLHFHLTIFLRSDIFRHILQFAREPDKIEYTRLLVDDSETLFRIIEERFCSLNSDATPEDLWDNYLPATVNGEQTKDYIFRRIIPRPRDMIFLFNKIKDVAVLRGHIKFFETDIIEALRHYSDWVFSSLIVENGVTERQMENFLYELAGESTVIPKSLILEKANNAGINFVDQDKEEEFIDHLVSLSILGREIQANEFEFEYSLENSKRNKSIAKKHGSNCYKIHEALVPALGCVN